MYWAGFQGEFASDITVQQNNMNANILEWTVGCCKS